MLQLLSEAVLPMLLVREPPIGLLPMPGMPIQASRQAAHEDMSDIYYYVVTGLAR